MPHQHDSPPAGAAPSAAIGSTPQSAGQDATRGTMAGRSSAARDLHRRHLRQRRAAVRGAADVHQDGAAAASAARRGVVGGDGVLPDRAARRLRLCPSAHALRAGTHIGRHPSGGDDRRRALRCRCSIASRLGPAAGSPARRSGCSGCSRSRSACRSSRSPPTARCCRPGSRAPITRPRRTRISSMPPAMSEASSRCSPIRSWSSRSCGSAIRPGSGRSASCC